MRFASTPEKALSILATPRQRVQEFSMPVLIALTAVVQAFFIFHVFRTGRPHWWAFVILGAPVIGCIAYYTFEVFPGSREHRTARRAAAGLVRAFHPHGALRECLAALELCPSVANKIAAANEYMRCGGFHEAVALYESTLQGPHADDPNLMLGLARAHVSNGTYREAQAVLDQLEKTDARFRPEEAALLRARTLEGLGETEAALSEYESVAERYVGLEPRCRYAMFLKRLGFTAQSNHVFKDLLEHAKRFRPNLASEQPWIDAARRHLVDVRA
jgi:hypothetical protein